jgi:hypothetical protein
MKLLAALLSLAFGTWFGFSTLSLNVGQVVFAALAGLVSVLITAIVAHFSGDHSVYVLLFPDFAIGVLSWLMVRRINFLRSKRASKKWTTPRQ